MSTFKSFKPKRFATKKANNYCNRGKIGGIYNNELCANCGYPSGKHNALYDTCPSVEEMTTIYKIIRCDTN